MSTGRAITIAAIAGTTLLIPVIVILGLGLYGSAITDDFPLADSGGPVLRIEPGSGPPGASITIRGTEWESRTLARIEMVVRSTRPAITVGGEVVQIPAPLPAVFVAEVIVSRAGTFTIEAQLPTTLPLAGGTDVEFIASASYRGGEPAGEASARLVIEPGPGRLDVVVRTEPDGLPAPDALVELRGEQGQLVAALRTGADGVARFVGLPPGVPYEARARVPGFGVLEGVQVQASEIATAQATFLLPKSTQGRIYVGGIAAAAPGGDRTPQPIAVIDLPSLAPMSQPGASKVGGAWAMAADPTRGWLFLADEIATDVQILDAASGEALDPIPLAFDLTVRVTDPEAAPVPGAAVRLLWMVRGQRVPVRTGQTADDGSVTFGGLISGSTYDVQVAAEGYLQRPEAPRSGKIIPDQTSTVEVQLVRPESGSGTAAGPVAAVPLHEPDRAPSTGLVLSDLAVDPATGLLYVTGSDLEHGHLFVIDPDERVIVHDWRVPTGVGDVVPRGDGRSVYVANRPFSTVTCINVETGEEEASATVPSWPEAITVDGQGNVYVASMREGKVSRLDGTSLAVRASRELEEGLNRLSILPDGSALLVSNRWTDTVTGLDPQSLTVKFLLPVARSPRALALDPTTGTLVVGSAERGTVALYSTATYSLRQQLVLAIPINDIATVSLGT